MGQPCIVMSLLKQIISEEKESGRLADFSGDSFGFLPEPPAALAAKTDDIVDIPMIVGWTSEDSSWVVPDPEGDGLTYQEFSNALQMSIGTTYPSDQVPALYQKALVHYNMTDPSGLTPYDIRSVGIDISTDVTMKSFIVKEARQFSKAAAGSGAHVFVYEYRHRPSYSVNPAWQLVTHMDEEGMCLGLPNGPSDLSYPQTSHHDRHVSELMTTWWSNFAKYGTPSPDWPKFGHRQDDQQILVIRPQPEVKQFDDHEPVVLWTGSSGLDE
ncbi:hypothetical protein EGW08_022319 [Elysia chlorotica]|uniref:Carboxylesterase type B domain-containing protein n=1 Tax=Elysia chlorotica TaxID=188477 RepID=A0A3S1H0R8_ELYCH|nr:hypothetical protein EGW08_022319 [Elysia chlorotica]